MVRVVSVAAGEMLNSLTFTLSHNCWLCGISSLHLTQTIYFPGTCLEFSNGRVNIRF